MTTTAVNKNKALNLFGLSIVLAAGVMFVRHDATAADTTRPKVSYEVPANGATGVPISGKIAVTFSEPMDPSTITTVTYTLRQGTTPVAGTVTYAGVTATFSPLGKLAPNTVYTARIKPGAKDLAGNAITASANDFIWSFTTGATLDTTAPTVSFTVPANAATGVPISQKIAATFSEAMDPLTISTTIFTLKQGTTPVAGTVTYAGVTATFNPSSALAPSTTYTATITTGPKDLAGNALASSFVWSFTTGASLDTTPPTVSFTAPANAATGVPISQKVAATFTEAMDPLTTTTLTFTLKKGTTPVVGTVIYAGVTATFNPLSPLAPNTIYTATITTGTRDLAGNALANSFVWSFTTGTTLDTTAPTVSFTVPANAATDVPINLNISAAFTEAMDPLTTTTVTFTLKQGTTPVVGTVTYAGVTATFNPLSALAPNTTYTATITTGTRDLAGNALANSFVWSFTTSVTPDTTAPTVSFTAPANAATGVPISQKIAATFSEAMDPLTTTTVTFGLKQGTTPVVGTVIYAGVTATFNPLSALAPNTTYTATITTGSRDLAGNALATSFVWSFTTGATLDTTAPTVSFTVPANAATGVPINLNISAAFSEAMDPLTMTTVTFTLKQGTTPVVGTVTYAGVTATFNPLSALAPSTTYTATITTGSRDLAGNALANSFVWSFTTGANLDTTAPIVNSTIPRNAASGVAISGNIAAFFSEAMDPLAITAVTFTLKQGTTPVAGTVTYAGVTATFNPLNNLAPNTTYTATITTGARDLAGNALANGFAWNFTTGATRDTTPPLPSSTVPANAAAGVGINARIDGIFSEAMDPLTLSPLTFTLQQGATPVAGTVIYAGVTATFIPLSNLASNTTYTATISTGARDLAGNPLASRFVWSFTTGATRDTTPPLVSFAIPADAVTGVPINLPVAITFSKTMDHLTIIAGRTFTLKQGTSPVAGAPARSLALPQVAVTGPAPVVLGSASTFSVLAASTVTSTGGTTVNGDLGLSPGTAVTGFPPGIVNGTIHAADAAAAQAQADLTTAYNDAAGRIPTRVFTPIFDLGGLTLTSGVYNDPSSFAITGTLTLDAQGDPNAVWIFQAGSTLVTASGSQVLLINGAQAANVFWQVGSSATLGTTSVFKGNILALASVTVTTGAAVEGRVLARTAAVTLDSNTITIPTGAAAVAVAGTVTYVGTTAIFTPLSALAPNTTYTATVTTAATDLTGNALPTTFVTSFTTGATVDTTVPLVSFAIPADAATGVAINQAINTTFTKTMDPITISTATFTLQQGTSPVAGAPARSLALPQVAVTGPAPVALGSASTFSVLAASTVTSTGGTTVNGDLGLSPGTAVTGFPPGIVNGTIHAADAAAAQAQADLTTAYNDAAGRTPTRVFTPIFDLGGLTLTSGVYNDPSSFAITGTLTLDAQGDPNAVWIFQAGSTLVTASGSQVLLINGAKAANVFWQVGSSATLGTTSIFKGNILALASITVTTGATVEGRLLARTAAVTLDSNTITIPTGAAAVAVAGTVTYVGTTATFTPLSALAPNTTYTATVTTAATDLTGNALPTTFVTSFTTGATLDTTAPTVAVTVPANAATGVALNQTINATFSEAMDPLTISTASLTVTGPGGTAVTGTVGYDVVSRIATFSPAGNLAANSVYGATITTGARDLAGNALAANFGWSFTTAASTAGQTPVALGSASTFSILAASTVTSTGGTTVNGDLGLSPGTAVTGFPPGIINGTLHAADAAAALAQSDLTTAYNDAAGRTPTRVFTPIFDLGGLTLTSGVYNDSSSFAITGTLTLDAQGDPNAVWIFQAGSTLVTASGSQVLLINGAKAANVFWQVGSSATLGTTTVFKGNILALASITATTSAAVEGRLLARTAAVTLDSNTVGLGIPAETTPPTVSSTDPANAATGVAINKQIAATFSEAMNPSTISAATFTLQQGTTPVAGTVSYAGTTATFAPASALAVNTTYTATITTGVTDLAGNALAANFAWNFTTAATTTGQPPVALGTAGNFAVLAASTVTSTGGTTVNGDLGLSPGTAVTGFPPGIVNGTIHAADAAAALAQADLTTAYNDAAGRTPTRVFTPIFDLGGLTLTSGVYNDSSSFAITGTLTLDAQGDPNAVWIFQAGSTLVTASGSQVLLSNGAKAANVFWQVGSSATLGTTSIFKGNILALASITVTTGATVEGRLLARTAAVTLDSNIITIPSSAAAAMLQSAAILQPAAILQSAALPTGPYMDSAGQSLNLATKTITIPLSGSMQFYRIRAGTALTIKGITVSGGNLVLTYH